MNTDKTCRTLAFAASAAWMAVFFLLSVKKYLAFNDSLDMGNIVQAFYNTLHGRFMQMTWEGAGAGVCRWAGHTELVFAFLVPFFALVPHPVTLLFLQALAIAAAGLALYFAARSRLNDPVTALLVLLAFLLFPFLPAITLADVHADPFFLLPFFLAWFFHLQGRRRAFWLCVALSLCCKEYMALPVALLGALIFLENRKIGGIVVLAALLFYGIGAPLISRMCGLTVFAVKTETHALVLPAMFTWKSVFSAMSKAMALSLQQDNLLSLTTLALLFGFAAYKSPRALIMVLPMLFMLFFLNQRALFGTHRHAILVPALFMVLTDGLARLAPVFRRRYALFGVALPSLILFFLFPGSVIGQNVREMFFHREYRNAFHYHYTAHDRRVDSLLRFVPAECAMASDEGIRTKTADRRQSFVPPYPVEMTQADVYVYDFFEALDFTAWQRKAERAGALLASSQYVLNANLDGVLFFQKGIPVAGAPAARLDTLLSAQEGDTGFSILERKVEKQAGNRYLLATVFHKGVGVKEGDALVSFLIQGRDTVRVLHTASYLLAPLAKLSPGRYREQFVFDAPEGFEAEKAVHIIGLYRKDAYLPLLSRSSFCLQLYP